MVLAIISYFMQDILFDVTFTDYEKPHKEEESSDISFDKFVYKTYIGNQEQIEIRAQKGFFSYKDTAFLVGDVYLKKTNGMHYEKARCDRAELKMQPLRLGKMYSKKDLKFAKMTGHVKLDTNDVAILADEVEYEPTAEIVKGFGNTDIKHVDGWNLQGDNGFIFYVQQGYLKLVGQVKGEVDLNEKVSSD
jgi:hypothetical protein